MMISITVCKDCGGYRMVSRPMNIEPTAGSADDCSSPCTCKPKDEEKEMAEAYTDYAKQEIRFCPYCGAALGIV